MSLTKTPIYKNTFYRFSLSFVLLCTNIENVHFYWNWKASIKYMNAIFKCLTSCFMMFFGIYIQTSHNWEHLKNQN